MPHASLTDDAKQRKIAELTRLFLHQHYCENDTELLLSHLDDAFSWFGAGEHEYAVDPATVIRTFRAFAGRVPRCEIGEEQYDVIRPMPDLFICTGMLWVATVPDSGICLRVHQRITTVFRWTAQGPRCCHLHLSNPYSEMDASDSGFPEKMAEESRRYLREQIELQKRQIAEQHDVIAQMYVEDLSTGLYNRNRYNQVCDSLSGKDCGSLGIAYFDLNGLKKINDLQGHQAGDALIRRTAECLLQAFGKKAYRIGGDEFIVIDRESGREAFHACVENALRAMEESHISISCGISWRAERGNIDEQSTKRTKRCTLPSGIFTPARSMTAGTIGRNRNDRRSLCFARRAGPAGEEDCPPFPGRWKHLFRHPFTFLKNSFAKRLTP